MASPVETATRNVSMSGLQATWPKITLVTPVFNAVGYIENTLRSVVGQGYPNLEYIVVDGGSTDGTVDVIQKYEHYLSWWVSEPDKGMYDAINKGFARSSGEIMGWINASDMLHTGALYVVGSVFRAFPFVDWITGMPTIFDEAGATVAVGQTPRWSRVRFLAGANEYIQQESTFWRRALWEKTGGYLDADEPAASDFDLWVRFFRHARLYTVRSLIGGFRVHEGSLNRRRAVEMRAYHRNVLDVELKTLWYGAILKSVTALSGIIQYIPKVRGVWRRALYGFAGPDLPPFIVPDRDRGWVMR